MHPAPSVILFTVLSGMGFGLLAFLGLGWPAPQGWAAFGFWGLGYGLAAGGLVASTFHLGNPQRFLRAFSQWRSSWLSREAWLSCAALIVLAPLALSDWLGLGFSRAIGWAGAGLALATILATAMIYAQIRAVPRWHHWTTPALFAGFALTGGAILSGQGAAAPLLCMLMSGLQILAFWLGDQQFGRRSSTIGSATGLGALGGVSVFEQPHTGGNYLTREMIHLVGRKHAFKLRVIAVLGSAVVPAVILGFLPGHWAAFALAALVHLIGALAARWLFFAQAEHVVGLYYGQR